MKKTIILTLLAFLMIVLGPVLLEQLQPAQPRTLRGELPDPARYEEIRFRNAARGIDLAGLLFVPQGTGPFPAAVIIHGSGTSSRSAGMYCRALESPPNTTRQVFVCASPPRGATDTPSSTRHTPPPCSRSPCTPPRCARPLRAPRPPRASVKRPAERTQQAQGKQGKSATTRGLFAPHSPLCVRAAWAAQGSAR